MGVAAAAASAVVAMAVGAARAGNGDISRYPFDPACAWGRVADGKGMIVRCLGEAEARQLITASASGVGAASAAAAAAGSTMPAGGTAPAAAPAGTVAPEAAPPAASAEPVTATVGPLSVDAGKLPAAEKKLRAVAGRFAECVQSNGGLTALDGEVRVRFLVHARGRAEGVEVTRRRAVSAEAASCVAGVVDRRWVGTPSEEMVGATLVVRFKKSAGK